MRPHDASGRSLVDRLARGLVHTGETAGGAKDLEQPGFHCAIPDIWPLSALI